MRFFASREVANLPPLAWLYTLEAGQKPLLIHGTSVEIRPDGFFEGCYSGSWKDGDFTTCTEVFGSGLKIREGEHCFVPPSHIFESLFTLNRSGALSVSNSLSFLLGYHHVALPLDLDYCARFATAARGIDAYEKHLAATPQGELQRVIYDNLIVGPDLLTTLRRRPMPPHLSDYGTYKDYLLDTMWLASLNAADRARSARYTLLATCSSGYDSAACAALARLLGCATAITLKTCRGNAGDSGRAVAEALGMRVIETERVAEANSFAEAAEFLATGMGGEDLCYLGFAPHLRRRILLTGFHGDSMWNRDAKPNASIVRGDTAACSLQEFRLRKDFLHMPVPLIGCRRHADVVAISQAVEMQPFTLHSCYDCPIARRLVEEQGVPRSLFGQQKKAASLLLFHHPGRLPRPANGEVILTASQQRDLRRRGAIWEMRMLLYLLLRRLGKILFLGNRLSVFAVREFRIFEHSHPQATVDFLQALSLQQHRYDAAKEAMQEKTAKVIAFLSR